jgi:protein gp37
VDEEAIGDPLRWHEPCGVVLGSQSDLFHPQVSATVLSSIFEVVAATPHLTYLLLTKRSKRMLHLGNEGLPFPANLWIGVSVERDDFTWRAEDLLRLNASSTWVAIEPMLGPVPSLPVAGLGWVVCAPESGPQARPLDPAWVRQVRDLCMGAGVPFYFGDVETGQRTPHPSVEMPFLDGRLWAETPFALQRGSRS